MSDTLQGPYILTKIIQLVIQSQYLNHNSAQGEICSLKQWVPYSAKSTLADLQVIDSTVPLNRKPKAQTTEGEARSGRDSLVFPVSPEEIIYPHSLRVSN